MGSLMSRVPARTAGRASERLPRMISDVQVEEVIVKTLESTPRDATHWSTRSLAGAGLA